MTVENLRDKDTREAIVLFDTLFEMHIDESRIKSLAILMVAIQLNRIADTMMEKALIDIQDREEQP